MNEDFDLAQLRQIPDPFAAVAARDLPPSSRRPAQPSPSPTRHAVRRSQWFAALAAVLYQGAWVAVLDERSDVPLLEHWFVGVAVLVPLFATALALGAVVSRGRRGLGVSMGWLAALSMAAPLLFAVITLALNPADHPGGPFVLLGLRCMAISLLFAAGPLALGAIVFRHAFTSASAWRTAALGVACGGLGAATMGLVCRDEGALHVVIAHGMVMVVAGAVGALLGRQITRA